MTDIDNGKKILYELLDTLESYDDMFDNEYIYKLRGNLKNFEENLECVGSENKTLNIGIMGAVKAGKSSFLNALIFDGEEVLPKAAVPMTAALTKISYSDTPHASVHFFSEKDWERITDNAEKYKKRIEDEYRKYEDEYDSLAQERSRGIFSVGDGGSKMPKKMNRSEFEKKMAFQKVIPEHEKASEELVEMTKGKDITSRLGETVELDGDVIAKLDQFVGAHGEYTPIVSYVEIKINNKALEGIEIIDTPGLNDPIISRSHTTMGFLSKCDVAVLLSTCGEFMKQDTINLMLNSLPDAGVREYLIIGSKLDSGIQNESAKDFSVARQKSLSSYKKTFEANIRKIEETSVRKETAAKLSKCPVLFISSQMFAISRKLKNNEPLCDDEQLTLNNMKRYSGFEPSEKFLLALSGINDVKKALDGVMKRKEKIISTKKDNLFNDLLLSVLRDIGDLQSELNSGRRRLENESIEDLNKRYTAINDVLASTRKGISNVFGVSALQIEKNSRKIVNDIRFAMQNYTAVKVRQESHVEHGTIRTGLFGLRKEHYTDTITDNCADSSQVITNIQSYIGKCQEITDEHFNFIFNTDNLKNEIKRIVLTAFNAAGAEFESDDILMPVNTIIARIQIPEIEINASPYIDMINSEFREGYAKNEAIHRLTTAQSNIMSAIQDDLIGQLNRCVENHGGILKEQSVCFTDDISKKINDELERLKKQIGAKQEYIDKFKYLEDTITKQKQTLQAQLRNKGDIHV